MSDSTKHLAELRDEARRFIDLAESALNDLRHTVGKLDAAIFALGAAPKTERPNSISPLQVAFCWIVSQNGGAPDADWVSVDDVVRGLIQIHPPNIVSSAQTIQRSLAGSVDREILEEDRGFYRLLPKGDRLMRENQDRVVGLTSR